MAEDDTPTLASNPTVAGIATLAGRAPARLGLSRLVLVDGPAGAGKTTLADRLAEALGVPGAPAPVVHGDDLYEGWTGLATLDEVLVGQVIEPLGRGAAARFERWDWERDERGDVLVVAPAPFVVIEGVGVASPAALRWASISVWVEAPWEVRIARGMARDGEAMRAHWERWETDQNALHAARGTRAVADVVVDGTVPVRNE